MIQLTDHAIDVGHVLEQVRSPRAGAVVLFLGTTRELTGQRCTESLDYECYAEMAEACLEKLEAESQCRWPSLVGICVVHRLGCVQLGEISVAIAVSSPHRNDAFAAGKWLIDTIKQIVPIWKRENWADGTSQWVHPGAERDEG